MDCVNGGLVGIDQVDGALAGLRVDGHFVGWVDLAWHLSPDLQLT